MTRIRTVKPAFFRHEELYIAEKESGLPLRLAFEGLWLVADREGRFAWKPREIKLDVLPYDDVDFSAILDALEKYGFIIRYAVNFKVYGFLPSFAEHQRPNAREAASVLPTPPLEYARTCVHVQEPGEREREREREEEREEEKRESQEARANCAKPEPNPEPIPPPLDEVRAYCAERGNAVDPVRFLDYHAARGWQLGGSPVKDWRAVVRTWETREKPAEGALAGRPEAWGQDEIDEHRRELDERDPDESVDLAELAGDTPLGKVLRREEAEAW